VISPTDAGARGPAERTIARARKAVHAAGERWTVVRQLVVEALLEAGGHLSVAQIHARSRSGIPR
jgi:Fe2+ or Zn2+ uptake regulation protein